MDIFLWRHHSRLVWSFNTEVLEGGVKPGGSPWGCSEREDDQERSFFGKKVASSKKCVNSLPGQYWDGNHLASFLML